MLNLLEIPVATSQSSARTLFKGRVPLTGQLIGVDLYVDGSNSNGATTADVHVNGATVFVDQTKRPSIAPGGVTGAQGAGALPVAVTKGQALQIDLDVAPPGGTQGVLTVLLTFEDGLNKRGTVVVATPSIASGTSSQITAPLGKAFIITKVTTNIAARVRVYASPAYRTADASRAPGQLPTGEHGVILDVVTEVTDLIKDASPDAVGANKEAVITADAPLSIENRSGAPGVVSITFERILLEA